MRPPAGRASGIVNDVEMSVGMTLEAVMDAFTPERHKAVFLQSAGSRSLARAVPVKCHILPTNVTF